MKVKAFVSTNKVGSKIEWECEFDGEELDGKTPEEREKYISDCVFEEMANYFEWGWSEQ